MFGRGSFVGEVGVVTHADGLAKRGYDVVVGVERTMVEVSIWLFCFRGGLSYLVCLVELEWRSHLVGDARCEEAINFIVPPWRFAYLLV